MLNRLFVRIAVLGTGMVVSAASSYAQNADIGKREYAVNCAVCHGEKGTGDGPIAELLKVLPADLTKIQKNNMGVFPFVKIYQVIEGREAIPAHGTREMPVWGDHYTAEGTAASLGNATPQELESYTRGRIIALIGYISTLQAK